MFDACRSAKAARAVRALLQLRVIDTFGRHKVPLLRTVRLSVRRNGTLRPKWAGKVPILRTVCAGVRKIGTLRSRAVVCTPPDRNGGTVANAAKGLIL